MNYGYARVSTTKQMTNGNSLEDQEKILREAGAEIIVKDAYTGTKMDRPAFTKLMQDIKPGDKLIVAKLDRFARSAVQGVEVVRDLMAKGVTVHILNMGIADNTPTGKLMVTMLLAFAEFERDMIVERTQAGKAIARTNGVRVDGRPKKFNPDKIQRALDRIENGESYKRVEEDMNISKSTLIRAMRERKAEGN
jgi:DNA invertase Pin-like site-specific DNA recombinase